MYKISQMGIRPSSTASRLIANYFTALSPLEKYLRRGRPLTGLQVEALSLALRTLETFLAVWKGGKGYKDTRAKHKSDRSWFLDVLDKNKNQTDKKTQMSRNWAAVMLGRRGGLKGGNARAKKLSPERRAAIASLAVRARWARRNRLKS